jgi:hypothetical protein
MSGPESGVGRYSGGPESVGSGLCGKGKLQEVTGSVGVTFQYQQAKKSCDSLYIFCFHAQISAVSNFFGKK